MIRIRDLRATRVALVLLLVLAVALAVAARARTSHAERTAASEPFIVDSPYEPIPLAKVQRTTALFVGDDFAAGFGGIGRNAFPRITCNELLLNCAVDAQVGTGLVSDGREFSTNTDRFVDRLPTDAQLYTPDVVVVDTGRNDLEVDPATEGAELRDYLNRVADIWRGSKIVVIAPSRLSAEVYTDHAARVARLSAAADSVGAMLIDPVAEGWFEGADVSTLLQPDGFHPNQAGQQLIADKLGQALLDRGIGTKGSEA